VSGERGLTRAELRAGLLRLAVILTLLVLSATAAGVLIAHVDGTSVRRGIANGFAIVGALVLVFGLVSWTRSGPLRREGLGARLAEADERREAERIAIGLIGIGIALFLAALLLG
jgi:hypothetical protein